MPMEAGLLAHVLAECVRVLRPDQVVLGGRYFGKPIARRGSGIDEFLQCGLVPRAIQHAYGPLRIDGKVFERALDRGDQIADAGEMNHVIGIPKSRIAWFEAPDIALLD